MMEKQEPIRILQVVTNMSYGGLENFIMNNYRSIDRTRVQFDFLTHFAGHQDYEEEIAALGGKLYRLPKLDPFSRSYLSDLKAFFKAHPEYKVVHSHLNCMSSVPLKAAMECGVPVRIAHSHNSTADKNLKYPLKLLYRYKIPGYATDFFACSDEAAQFTFRNHPCKILNNAIDSEAFRYNSEIRDSIREKLHISDKLVIGHVGMFRKQKNHSFLLEVFKEILSKDKNAVLLSAGNGPLFEKIKMQAASLGISNNVIFLGGCDNVHELMQAMDIMVFPSFYEGFGIVPLEAQAAGLPIITSKAVPENCLITDYIMQIDLSIPCSKWAEAVFEFATKPRADCSGKIKSAGFDISANAKWLEDFYVGKHNGK